MGFEVSKDFPSSLLEYKITKLLIKQKTTPRLFVIVTYLDCTRLVVTAKSEFLRKGRGWEQLSYNPPLLSSFGRKSKI